MSFAPISEKEDRIGKSIVDAAFAVHKNLGPGLLESICEVCFCHELHKRNLSCNKQVVVSILYDNINFNVPLIKNGIKRIVLKTR